MRIKQITVLTLAATVALGLGACTTEKEIIRETETVTVAPSTSTATAANPALDECYKQLTPEENQAAVGYYLSDERRAPLQEALVRIGNDWMGKMLTGEIPSTTRGWEKMSAAPYDGYGSLVSVPSKGPHLPGNTFVQVNVHFVDGQVDLGEAPSGIFIITKFGRMLNLDGVERNSVNPPLPYSWYTSTIGGGVDSHVGMFIGEIEQGPVYKLPLDPSKQYKILGGSCPAYMSVADIKAADTAFLAELNALNVTGSDWS